MRKKIIYLLIIVAFGFLIQQIFNQWPGIAIQSLKFNPINLIITIFLLFLGYLLNIISWHFLTKSLNLNIPIIINLKVWILSSVTRFLPGKIWQYPTRIYLLSEEKIPPVAMGATIVGEVVLNLSLGAAVILVALLSWELPAQISFFKPALILFAASPILFILFASERLIKLAGKLLHLVGKNPPELKGVKFDNKWIIPTLLTFFLRFWLWGLVLFYLASSIMNIDISLLPVFVGAFSISWLLGYIAPFAPAGLGVADFSLAAILTPYLTFPVSSLVAVIFRASTLLTEGTFFLILLIFLKFRFTFKRQSRYNK